GLSSKDAFGTIQKAIHSAKGGDKDKYDIIKVAKGRYETGPIFFTQNNLEIIFEEGVEVVAKSNKDLFEPNLFKGKNDCLFTAKNRENIRMVGYGAVFRMRKTEYLKLPGEWRHIIDLRSCTNITIAGLTLRDGGNDGIYIGLDYKRKEHPYCEDILIKDVICDNNARSAITATSVDGLIVDNCVLKNTGSILHNTESGIDFETQRNYTMFKDIVVRNTKMENNGKYGISMNFMFYRPDPPSVSMTFENIQIIGSSRVAGICMYGLLDDGPKGFVKYKDVVVEGTKGRGVLIKKSFRGAKLIFDNCVWKDTASLQTYADSKGRVGPIHPIDIVGIGGTKPGGIEFKNCQIFDDGDRPAIAFSGITHYLHRVKGSLHVENGSRKEELHYWKNAKLYGVDLKINRGVADFAQKHMPKGGN
ncbi:right-handed parallel beta-helix repeat-containing protein, partial [Candidatus Pacearchaeota archaeon]|nr:right-handed parallel beta-helix repeat-containing protein [Candidatus Pacearchaeota archaeon]